MSYKSSLNSSVFLEKAAKLLGFVVSLSIFSTIFYFILTFTKKIPDYWSIFHIALIVLSALGVSYLIKKILQ